MLDNDGADVLMAVDVSEGDAEHEESIGRLKRMVRGLDAPVFAGGCVERVEDVKKYLYAGARMVYLKASEPQTVELLREVSDRFGREKIAVWLDTPDALARVEEYGSLGAGMFLLSGKDCPRDGFSFPVYLLSEEELSWLVEADVNIRARPTAQAVRQDQTTWYNMYSLELGIEAYYWWLREPVPDTASNCYVVDIGYRSRLLRGDKAVGLEGFGVRPAVKVDTGKITLSGREPERVTAEETQEPDSQE